MDRSANGRDRLLKPASRHDLVRAKLLAWFRREKRRLPWRGTRDPYRIWVSEVMLQQTTVGAVHDRYGEFLRRFPDLRSLARSNQESVLAAWSGLGYYARARHLHRAARELEGRRGGRWPRRPDELRELPGFGEYMAAAVASLAFGVRVHAADANVTRVLSRLDALGGAAGSRQLARSVAAAAKDLVARGRPGDVTAALMDLGQLVCTPRRPACAACPLADLCIARKRGDVAIYPERRARPKATEVFVAAACARDGDETLLVRSRTPRLGGLWQFPSAEGPTPAAARARLRREIRRLGLVLESGAAPSQTRHTIMNRRLEIRVYAARADGRPLRPNAAARGRAAETVRWFTPARLAVAAIPTLTRRIAAAAGLLKGAVRPGP